MISRVGRRERHGRHDFYMLLGTEAAGAVILTRLRGRRLGNFFRDIDLILLPSD